MRAGLRNNEFTYHGLRPSQYIRVSQQLGIQEEEDQFLRILI